MPPRKPGRKPRPDRSTIRDRPIRILVTPAEKRRLERRARAEGLPLATWLRTRALAAL